MDVGKGRELGAEALQAIIKPGRSMSYLLGNY